MTKKTKPEEIDRKSAAAGAGDDVNGSAVMPVQGGVFDGPIDDEEAIAQLVELNHTRQECERVWDVKKQQAADAKKELDNASNAISLLIDRIDRQRSGRSSDQPVLRTLEEQANPASLS